MIKKPFFERIKPLLYLLPFIISVSIFTLYPIVNVIRMSFFLPSGYLQYIPLCIAGGSDFDGDRDRSGDSSESEDQVPVFLPDGLLPADGYFIAGSRSCLEIHV